MKPGQSITNPGDTADSWMADLSAAEYGSAGADSNYIAKWSGGTADIHQWWTGSSISYLYSEILYKIYSAYQADGKPSPFGTFDPNAPESDYIDALFFVFLSRQSPFGDFGGTTWIEVHSSKVFQFEAESDVSGLDFFGMIKTNNSDAKDEFQGTGQTQNSSDFDEVDPEYYIENSAMVILHEFVHTLGFGEGPPALQGLTPSSIGRYYWGNLNVSSQKYYPAHGIPIMSLHNLEQMG